MPRDVTQNFVRVRKLPPGRCAKGSYRTKRLKGGKQLTLCCPKGRYNKKKGQCRTALKLQSVATPCARMGGSVALINSVRIVEDKP